MVQRGALRALVTGSFPPTRRLFLSFFNRWCRWRTQKILCKLLAKRENDAFRFDLFCMKAIRGFSWAGKAGIIQKILRRKKSLNVYSRLVSITEKGPTRIDDENVAVERWSKSGTSKIFKKQQKTLKKADKKYYSIFRSSKELWN